MSQLVDRKGLEELVALVREAGEITLRWFRQGDFTVEAKGDGTPVTEADRAAERFLREELGDRFPLDAIVGEEEAAKPGTSGRQWVIDPIDGTKAFTRGVPLYSNLLALRDEAGSAVGIINLPALGSTVYAARGLGCFDNGRPARVSATRRLAGAYVTTSAIDNWSSARLTAVREAGIALRTWGDGYGYALVATGRVDAMVDPEIAPWDVAPMPVILAEAGGRFTDLSGRDRIDGGHGLGSNAALHDELLALL